CGGGSSSPTTPGTTSAPYSQTDLVVGTGATANTGNTVTVTYTGWLYDSSKPDAKGAQFDCGTFPPFVLGAGRVIRGWAQGIVGMRVGGQQRVVIPHVRAYGNTSHDSKIQAHVTLDHC